MTENNVQLGRLVKAWTCWKSSPGRLSMVGCVRLDMGDLRTDSFIFNSLIFRVFALMQYIAHSDGNLSNALQNKKNPAHCAGREIWLSVSPCSRVPWTKNLLRNFIFVLVGFAWLSQFTLQSMAFRTLDVSSIFVAGFRIWKFSITLLLFRSDLLIR